jgi:hypothetical protein
MHSLRLWKDAHLNRSACILPTRVLCTACTPGLWPCIGAGAVGGSLRPRRPRLNAKDRQRAQS